MNLEKEIQLFEEWCDIFGLPTDEVDGEYTDPRTAIAFLAWYEVVSREGYKLVPLEASKACLSNLGDVIFDNFGTTTTEVDRCAEKAYKAMIGAVE